MDDETKAAFAGVQAAIRSMETELDVHYQALFRRMNDGFERVGNNLTAIRDDIAVAMGSSDQMQRANDNTRADLRSVQEQVSLMWKQVKRLETRVDGIEGGSEVPR